MSEDWNTKYGTRRVRRDPPTLEEAIYAAVGITDDQQQQAEIAAALMGLPYEEVLAEVKKTGRALARSATRVIAGRRRRMADVFKQLKGRIDNARAWRVGAAGALIDRADDVVAVPRLFCEQGAQRAVVVERRVSRRFGNDKRTGT